MAFGKSVLVTMEITVAGSSHNCRFNSEHRIKRGESRLTITEDRSKLNYCLPCAKKFLEKGIVRLQKLQDDVDCLLSQRAKSVGETK